MGMELERVQKPLRQLRKSLKRLPDNPPPEIVHKLRTRTRRIEAIAAALTESDEKQTRRLLKALKPVRKAAGGVRDMDVLTGNALSLPKDSCETSLVRLVEHLGMERQKSAEELLDALDAQRKSARHSLKKYAKQARAALGNGTSSDGAHIVLSEDHVRAVTSELVGELSRWPALSLRNIHPFRLKVKELRSILQLFRNFDRGFVDALGNAKNQIGDWHDWQQLAEVAGRLLDPQQDRSLLSRIRTIEKRKAQKALTAANTLRARYLTLEPGTDCPEP
jgi:CHAD domain-containing protein